jgi:hypothetical protein
MLAFNDWTTRLGDSHLHLLNVAMISVESFFGPRATRLPARVDHATRHELVLSFARMYNQLDQEIKLRPKIASRFACEPCQRLCIYSLAFVAGQAYASIRFCGNMMQ